MRPLIGASGAFAAPTTIMSLFCGSMWMLDTKKPLGVGSLRGYVGVKGVRAGGECGCRCEATQRGIQESVSGGWLTGCVCVQKCVIMTQIQPTHPTK